MDVKLIGGLKKELIIINDYSTDSTSQVIKEYISDHSDIAIKLFEQPVNMGKGAA